VKYNFAGVKLTLIMMIWSFALHARAADSRDVWFSPDNDTPDFVELFTRPEAWKKGRTQVKVFKFGPQQVESVGKINSYTELFKADAFRKLKNWKIDIAIDVPAVKEWDCVGDRAAKATLRYVENVRAAGAAVRFLSMDEALVSGVRACHLTFDETAARTAAYVKKISSTRMVAESGNDVIVGEAEPYPSYSTDDLKRWIKALGANGFRPGFFHLDVDVNHVNSQPNIDLIGDLRILRSFFAQERIPFGVIFWGGHGPEASDKSYYDHVIDFVRRVHSAIGKPEESIFQSWVLRVSQTCSGAIRCGANDPRCTSSDPPYCGTRSVPVNLPDDDPSIFSHTRLIREALRILGSQ
jgi:hypothetical protein